MNTILPELRVESGRGGTSSEANDPFHSLDLASADTKPDVKPIAPPSKPAPQFVPLPAPTHTPEQCPRRKDDDDGDGKWPACRR